MRAMENTARSTILNCKSPARVLEFYYWSREDGLADVVRALARLSPATRRTLQDFLGREPHPRLIVAIEKSGRLVLSASATAAEHSKATKNNGTDG